MIDTLKERFQYIKGGRILDVATQNGQFIQRLINAFKDYREIIGIDTDENSLKKAQEMVYREKLKDVGFLKMNCEKMDFVDDSFDFVSISNSLHHLKNLKKCLEEMKRVLLPGGCFIIAEMYSDVERASQMSHVLFHHWAAKVDMQLGVYHEETLKRDEIINICNNLQLTETEILPENMLSEVYFDESVLETFYTYIDKMLERVKDHGYFTVLRDEGESIKQHIKKNGWESAPQIIIIGKKAH